MKFFQEQFEGEWQPLTTQDLTDIGNGRLNLGAESGFVAVKLTGVGLDWWLSLSPVIMDRPDSATLDASDAWYILFRGGTKYSHICGVLSNGVEVISTGHAVMLPPSANCHGDCGCWVEEYAAVLDLPDWIITSLSVAKVA